MCRLSRCNALKVKWKKRKSFCYLAAHEKHSHVGAKHPSVKSHFSFRCMFTQKRAFKCCSFAIYECVYEVVIDPLTYYRDSGAQRIACKRVASSLACFALAIR